MARLLPAALIALCAALGIALAVQRSSLTSARMELDEVRNRVERLESKQKDMAARKAVDELQEQVAKVERKAASASVTAEQAASAALVRPAPKDAAGPVPFTEEDIEKIVEARLEEKLKKGASKKLGDDERKMPLFDLAKELTLDPAAQAKVAEIANVAKKEILEILKTPRPDGTSAADDVIQALTANDQAEAQKVFLKLFTENIPGTTTTYVTAVARVQEKANRGLSTAMGPDAFGKFQHMGVRPENIQTGFDPWADYLQQKGK